MPDVRTLSVNVCVTARQRFA